MKKFNLYDVYQFGQHLGPLERISHDSKILDFAVEMWFARNSLTELLPDTSPLLPTSRRAVGELISAITRVLPVEWTTVFAEEAKDKTFGYGFAGAITNGKSSLETVLKNDMPGIASYLVAQKGIYSTDGLIDHADHHFPEEIRKSLSIQACLDLREAGKCLAYEVSTACAFHLWRAVETVMGDYYRKLASKSFEDAGVQRNWAAYVKALNDAGADGKITQFLDHIRSEYRNPQTHPEAMLTVNEAQGLFGVATSAIHQMILAIQKP